MVSSHRKKVTVKPRDDGGGLAESSVACITPAYDTKHVEELKYPLKELNVTLRIHQSSVTQSTSSSLWLSAQVLGAYLLSQREVHSLRKAGRSAVELGAGTGFLSILLAHCGWNVLATDLPDVIQGVLRTNVDCNRESARGCIETRDLDWLAEDSVSQAMGGDCEPPELIVSADTLYASGIVDGLWQTFKRILSIPSARGASKVRGPRGLLALERRDPQFIDASLACAEAEHDLCLRRVDDKALSDAVASSLGWDAEVWDGVEIWEVTLPARIAAV
ncbi:unnamed protein product [Parajaminaea phylloscopi]